MKIKLMPHTVARYFSMKIVEDVPTFKNIQSEIRYGLEWILSGMYQIVLILIISLITSTVKEAMACLLCGAVYRSFAGGAHFSKYSQCLIVGTIQVFVILLISLNIHINDQVLQLVIISSLIWGIIITIIYAPKLYKKRELFTQKKKILNKLISVSILALVFLAGYFTSFNNPIFLSAWLGLLFQVFTITFTSEKLIKTLDNGGF
jgi:accessory gene regulator B